jgi:hypothetical protein
LQRRLLRRETKTLTSMARLRRRGRANRGGYGNAIGLGERDHDGDTEMTSGIPRRHRSHQGQGTSNHQHQQNRRQQKKLRRRWNDPRNQQKFGYRIESDVDTNNCSFQGVGRPPVDHTWQNRNNTYWRSQYASMPNVSHIPGLVPGFGHPSPPPWRLESCNHTTTCLECRSLVDNYRCLIQLLRNGVREDAGFVPCSETMDWEPTLITVEYVPTLKSVPVAVPMDVPRIEYVYISKCPCACSSQTSAHQCQHDAAQTQGIQNPGPPMQPNGHSDVDYAVAARGFPNPFGQDTVFNSALTAYIAMKLRFQDQDSFKEPQVSCSPASAPPPPASGTAPVSTEPTSKKTTRILEDDDDYESKRKWRHASTKSAAKKLRDALGIDDGYESNTKWRDSRNSSRQRRRNDPY